MKVHQKAIGESCDSRTPLPRCMLTRRSRARLRGRIPIGFIYYICIYIYIYMYIYMYGYVYIYINIQPLRESERSIHQIYSHVLSLASFRLIQRHNCLWVIISMQDVECLYDAAGIRALPWMALCPHVLQQFHFPMNVQNVRCVYLAECKAEKNRICLECGAIFRSRRPSVSWIFAPKTFCLTNQLFGLGATNSFGLGAPTF